MMRKNHKIFLALMLKTPIVMASQVFNIDTLDRQESIYALSLGLLGAIFGAIYRTKKPICWVIIIADIMVGVMSSGLMFIFLNDAITTMRFPLSLNVIVCLSAGFYGKKTWSKLMNLGQSTIDKQTKL